MQNITYQLKYNEPKSNLNTGRVTQMQRYLLVQEISVIHNFGNILSQIIFHKIYFFLVSAVIAWSLLSCGCCRELLDNLRENWWRTVQRAARRVTFPGLHLT